MACDLGFQELANLNPFVKDLDEQGYQLDFINGYFVIYGLPYLDKDGHLRYGDWVSPVDLTEEGAIDPPGNHQAWFRGDKLHDQDGRELAFGTKVNRLEVTASFAADFSFSLKLLDENGQMRKYHSFEEKVQTYIDAITAPAIAAYPDATPLRGIEVKSSRPK